MMRIPSSVLCFIWLAAPLAAQTSPHGAGEPVEQRVATLFAGRVLDVEGRPTSGAVVVSSAGGQAVTSEYGEFRLEVGLAPEVRSIELTAVQGSGSALASLSTALRSIVPGSDISTGDLQLQLAAPSALSWLPTFGGGPGLNYRVQACTAFDDGSGGGPELYVGGEFLAAGAVVANYVAKWDGAVWSDVGSGMNNTVRVLEVYDDGGGPALFAGGEFTTAGGAAANRIAKWDGGSWSAIGSGMNSTVLALTVHDDGGGSALYAGGGFSTANGVGALRIAKWDGTSWSALGSGMNNTVHALASYDDGGGAKLVAGGRFTSAGGVALNRIAQWDGASWSALATGILGSVWALTSHDDGGGARLYAGGSFATAGGLSAKHIAKWDGTTWATLGSGMSNTVPAVNVFALTSFDDGGGAALYVGGQFAGASGVPADDIAKWDGSNWSALGSGMSKTVKALTVYDDGGGAALIAGGEFTAAGGVGANYCAQWDGANWAGVGGGVSGIVRAIAVHDDGGGGGPALFVGGTFISAGNLVVNSIAKWDGGGWSALGSGVNSWVTALAVFDDGSGGGPALFAGGIFTQAGGAPANRVAKWDGSSWSELSGTFVGGGVGGQVNALVAYDDGSGPALFIGGTFISANGILTDRIVKWDGTSWLPLGSGVSNTVWDMALFDDGGGQELHVGGQFTTAGGTPVNYLAKWDGTSWSAAGGSGTNSWIYSLAVHDDGGGDALFAGGAFTQAGGAPASRIAKWDGSAWSPLAGGMNNSPFALSSYDDGSGAGPALYAGGAFTTADGVAVNRIARWDSSGWSALESGVDSTVWALAVHDDGLGDGPALYAGGQFVVSPAGDSYIARWGGCTGPTNYCTAGTSASGCQASLSASGTSSASAASGFDLMASGVEGNKDGLFFFATNGRQANSWGSGTSLQCVVPPVKRAGLLAGSGTSGACDGAFAQDLNARWTAKPAQNPGAGSVVQAQFWFRDPFNTSNQTTSLSDAIEFCVAP